MDFELILSALIIIILVLAMKTYNAKILAIISLLSLIIITDNIILILLSIGLIAITDRAIKREETIFFIMLLIGFMGIMTENMMQIFLSLELINFIAIILIPLHTSKILSLESSLKYFIISALSSAILIIGIALGYLENGNLNLFDNTSISSGILMLISIAIKIGLVPLHIWLPEAYAGANYKTLLIISTFPKIFLILIMYYLCKFFNLETILIMSFILSFWAGIIAIAQEKIKKFLAYTFIFNNIFLLLSLLTNNLSYATLTFFLYFINILLTFSILFVIPITSIQHIPALNKILSLMLGISLFSAVGVPPLSGFIMKAIPFAEINNLFLLLIVVVFCGFLFYYLRLIATLFFYINTKQTYSYTSINITPAFLLFINLMIMIIFIL